MSPEVWSSAKSIIIETAADYALPLELPNEDFNTPEPPGAWVSIDIGGEAAQALELGNLGWIERGSIWIHVLIPFGSGVEAGLEWRKAFSVAFRAAQPNVEGLHYREHSFDPLGADDGVWRRLSLIVRYDYDDRLTHDQTARASFGGGGGVVADTA